MWVLLYLVTCQYYTMYCNTPDIMSAQTTQSDKILELVREAGVLRPRDLDPYGIPRTYLSRLCAAGKLQRIGRGLYVLPQSSTTEHHSLVEVCKRVPNGVVYLLSALRFHEITTHKRHLKYG